MISAMLQLSRYWLAAITDVIDDEILADLRRDS